ncbi:2Fe-2S iron-sulfur cluster-binding protein [Streptomyces sp. NRRL B-3229]|uniref:2Fe-2S iron-sulfur cluster-binding protein n=1 Tax=Streptomyces sp. NRRL B-3229 TaxID=1463836 RepID=UPI0004C04F95|nr:(2Fe-2S)-binding protein [Streptomyces sp. NRRL B-3229]
MTDDQHGEGTPRAAGRWDPLPQGDYDDGATAFVKLPEGGIDALLASADSPLAAPGHGYVPPRITAAPGEGDGTDPGATGAWGTPAEGSGWPDANAVPPGQTGQFSYNPATTQQWHVEDTAAAPAPTPAPGHDVTGQWSIPVAGGDLPDESGEFTTSSLVEQWGGTPPATLPGGAAAPWATQPAPPVQPWADDGSHGFDDGGTGAFDGGSGGTVGDGSGGTVGGEHAHVPAGDDHTRVAAEHEHMYVPGDEHAVSADDGGASADARTDGEGSGLADTHGPSEAHGSAGAYPDSASTAASEPAPDAEGHPAAPESPEGARGAVEAADGPADADAEHTPARTPSAPDDEQAPPPAEEHAGDPDDRAAAPGEEHPLASYVLRVNGVDRPVTDAWIGESLLYVLRERLGLAGAKDGCSQGECGACNVQVDGRLVASCLVPSVTAAGSEVRTVEGLAEDGRPSDVQRALARCGAVQCGFCVPGMAMTVHDLLEGNPAPTELETRQALCGNLCRCSGYRGVVDAVKEVVAEREAHAAAEAETDGDEPRIPHQAGPGAGGVNPSAFDSPGFPSSSGPHEQAYGQGQDGGQT